MVSADKLETLTAYLAQGECRIAVDSRQPGVIVPERFREPALILKLSHRYAPGDLTIDAWGIRVTLSFDRVESGVCLPWAAVFAAASLGGGVENWEHPGEPPALGKRRGGLALVIN